jgi:hypothetical protein
MSAKSIPAARLAWCTAILMLLVAPGFSASAADMKLQSFLLWGTDDSKPPEGKNYQPASAEIRQKLKDLPLKWTNWFEVRRVDCTVPQGVTKEVAMSEKCQVKIAKLPGHEIEVCLIGKGKEVMRQKQPLPKGEMLVLGGNPPHPTPWLGVLKRVE